MSTLEEITIAMSHEDFDTWSTLTVGFNYTKSLVICLTFYDYKNVQHHTYAIIEKDEAMAMSEHLDVKLTDLPLSLIHISFSTNTNVARFINHGHAKTGKAVIRIKILNQPGTSRDDFSFSIL